MRGWGVLRPLRGGYEVEERSISSVRQPVTILLVASYAPSLVNFRGPLIEDLVARGHDVHVAAPDIATGTGRTLRTMGAKVHETPLSRQGLGPLSDLRYMRTLRRLIRRTGAEIVVTYTIKPNIWGAFAAARANARSVAMVTGLGLAFTDTGTAGLRTSLMRRAARLLYRRATRRNWRVIFQNPDDRDDFLAAGCLADPGKVRMLNGSGVDLDHYVPAPLGEKPDFLMVARILGAKGVREYARAAVMVRRTHPQARFRLVGFFDGGPDAIAPAEMAEWQAGGLDYLGPSDDVRPHLAACRVYVLPSYREGTPRSVLEAMATGRAILTSDAPGCRETVEHGRNGYLVPVRDAEALAARMRELIDAPELTARMAAESLAIAREKYDVHKVNAELMRHLGLSP